MSGIRLSPKHGVNPSLMICYFCGGDSGVALLGQIHKGNERDVEAPRRAVYDREPCESCKGHMAAGVILIEVMESHAVEGEPTRTGGFAVVRDEAIRRIVNDPELATSIIRKRVCFLPREVWSMMGLPKGGA